MGANPFRDLDRLFTADISEGGRYRENYFYEDRQGRRVDLVYDVQVDPGTRFHQLDDFQLNETRLEIPGDRQINIGDVLVGGSTLEGFGLHSTIEMKLFRVERVDDGFHVTKLQLEDVFKNADVRASFRLLPEDLFSHGMMTKNSATEGFPFRPSGGHPSPAKKMTTNVAPQEKTPRSPRRKVPTGDVPPVPRATTTALHEPTTLGGGKTNQTMAKVVDSPRRVGDDRRIQCRNQNLALVTFNN